MKQSIINLGLGITIAAVVGMQFWSDYKRTRATDIETQLQKDVNYQLLNSALSSTKSRFTLEKSYILRDIDLLRTKKDSLDKLCIHQTDSLTQKMDSIRKIYEQSYRVGGK